MSPRIKRSGLLQVAELSGVSLSTVDRVLNERGSVSDDKRRKVLAVARALGVRPGLPSPVNGPLRIDVLLSSSATDHFKRMQTVFARLEQRLHSRVVLRTQRWPENDPGQLVAMLKGAGAKRQGLIVYAHDTLHIRETLSTLVRRGTPTVLLTSDLSETTGAVYVGIDNYTAGRTAGRLMSRWLPPVSAATAQPDGVLLIVNSLLYNAHHQRAKGFLEVMARHAPHVPIIGPLQCFDDQAATQAAVENAGPIAGIYDTGSGSTGIRAALQKLNADPVWIGHEASAQHAELLREGSLSLVLDQDPEGQAQAAIDYLLFAHGLLSTPPLTHLQLKIVIDENL